MVPGGALSPARIPNDVRLTPAETSFVCGVPLRSCHVTCARHGGGPSQAAARRPWWCRGVACHVGAGPIDDGHRPVAVDDRPHLGRIAAGDRSDFGVAESAAREDRFGARRGPAAVLLACTDEKREEGSERGLELDWRGTVVLVAHGNLR